MEHCLAQEKQFTLTLFTCTDAYAIGSWIAQKAIRGNLPIVIDIHAYGKTLFHFAHDLASVDNENWARRKRNTVMHFHHSSKYFYLKVNGDQDLIETKYGLSRTDYATIHGSFPIRLIHGGVVGAITVSGLKPEEDHDLVLEALSAHTGIAQV